MSIQRKILAFHRDEQGHWVAELECGHHQHVRHRPPWINRPWVVSEEGRRRHIGRRLNCKLCDLEEHRGEGAEGQDLGPEEQDRRPV